MISITSSLQYCCVYIGYYLLYLFRVVTSYIPFIDKHIASPDELTLGYLKRNIGEEKHLLESFKIVSDDNIKAGLANISQLTKLELKWSGSNTSTDLESTPKTIIIKSTVQTIVKCNQAMTLGFKREGKFYLAAKGLGFSQINQSNVLPIVYHVDMSNIDPFNCTIFMQDLTEGCVSIVKLLGNQCWGIPTIPESLLKGFNRLSMLEKIFSDMAVFHSKNWRNKELLVKNSPSADKYQWIKNRDWLVGENREGWEFGIQKTKDRWIKLQKEDIPKRTVQWSPVLINTINRAIENTSWERFRERFNIDKPSTDYTLIHGDFHGGNMLWSFESKRFYLVDWAEVGVWSPFADMTQFLISDVDIQFRRLHEEALFRLYWEKLVECGAFTKQDNPFHDCFTKYKMGGMERWFQLYIILVPMIPDFAVTYFHDQLTAFVKDHIDSIPLDSLSLLTCYNMI